MLNSFLLKYSLFLYTLLLNLNCQLSIVQVPLIDADGSALPLSIIPHGVPLKRGFPAVQVVIHETIVVVVLVVRTIKRSVIVLLLS